MKKIFVFLLAMIATMNVTAQVVSDSVAHANGLWKENDVAYIDLGLPSGTCWAVHNLGSSKNKNPGYYMYLKYDGKDVIDPTKTLIGKNWSIPTKEQWDELITNTEFYWNIMKDNPGVMLRSKINGHFLYLGAYGMQTTDERIIGDNVGCVYPCRDNKDGSKFKYYKGTKDGICSVDVESVYSTTIRAVIVKHNLQK